MKREPKRRTVRMLRFTREGRVFVLVTLGVGAAAVNTGNNLLYLVLGMLLSLIVLSGVLSEIVLRRLRVRRRLPQRAFAGSACLIEIAVENAKRRAPSYSIEIEDYAPDEATDRRCYFLKIGPGQTQTASYQRTPERRGVLRLSELRVRTRYPFGLFEKARVIQAEDELIVYPRLAHDAQLLSIEGRLGAEAPTRHRGPGSEIHGLRDYRDGDEARGIHWRRSASLGRVVVREHQRDATRRLTLVLDEARPTDADERWDEELEHVVSRAAATAARALDSGSTVDVVARSGGSPLVLPGQPPDPLWRFLALLTAVSIDDAPPLPQRAGAVVRFTVAEPRRVA